MRRNIFDIIEEEMNLTDEIDTVMTLFNNSRLIGFNTNERLEDFFDQYCIHTWKNRKYVTSSEQMRERLGITDEDIRRGLDEEHIFVLLEFILNVATLCDAKIPECTEWTKEFDMLCQNAVNIVNSLNYEMKVFQDMEKVILVEKSAASTSVAEIMHTMS